MDLPKIEKSFQFDKQGELSGKRWEGTFTVKSVLNIADKRKVEIEKSLISADLMNPTGDLSAYSTVISNLRVRVVNGPDWFKQAISSLEFLDEDVFFELYKICLEKSQEWLDDVKKQSAPEDKKGN